MSSEALKKARFIKKINRYYSSGTENLDGYIRYCFCLSEDYKSFKIEPCYFNKQEVSINRLFYMIQYYSPVFLALYYDDVISKVAIKEEIVFLPTNEIEQLLFPLSLDPLMK